MPEQETFEYWTEQGEPRDIARESGLELPQSTNQGEY